jgi:hypothetical protein
MDDVRLGCKLHDWLHRKHEQPFRDLAELEELGRFARTLLAARPEVTREAVSGVVYQFTKDWTLNQSCSLEYRTDLAMHVLSHFVPPPAPLPISGMSAEEIQNAMEDELNGGMPDVFICARVAHRLAQPAQMDRFDITGADIGRYVRRISTGEIGRVSKDPGNNWLHPGVVYEWRRYRDDLEYVEVSAAKERGE